MVGRITGLALAALLVAAPAMAQPVVVSPGLGRPARTYANPDAGAPTVGAWRTGDTAVDSTGAQWVCTSGGTPGTWAQSAAAGAITDHVNDTTDAHDASAISVAAIDGLAATDAQAAIAEVAGDIAAFAGATGTTATTWTVQSGADGTADQDASVTLRSQITADGGLVGDIRVSGVLAGGDTAGLGTWIDDVGGSAVAPSLTIGKPGDFGSTAANVGATLLLRGHATGAAVGTATTATIATDPAGKLTLTPTTTLSVATAASFGGTVTISPGDLVLDGAAKVDGVDVSALPGDISSAQGTADAAIPKSTGTVASQIAYTTGASAWSAATISEGSAVGGLAGGTVGSLTPAQLRAAVGLTGQATVLCPDVDAPSGADNSVAVDRCVADGADVYTAMTGNTDTQTREECYPLPVPGWATAWDATAGITLRYKIVGTGRLTLKVYDTNDPIGTPCYASGAGSSAAYATITATASDLSSCTVPAGGVVKACAYCATDTAGVCYSLEATVDVE